MATLEEIIRKRKETEGKGNTTTLERILVERNLRTHGNNSKAIKGYNDWIGRVNASRDKYIEDAKSRADTYQPSNLFNSYADTTDAEIKALAQEGQKYREHFLKYGDLYGADMANMIRSSVDDVDSYLHDLSVGLGAERRDWEGFTDLEDYNTKRAAAEAAKKEAEEYAKKKEEFGKYDFEKSQVEINDLQAVVDTLNRLRKEIDVTYNGIQAGGRGYANEQKRAELQAEYDKWVSQYGELSELASTLSDKQAYHEEAQKFLDLDKMSNYGNPSSEYYDPNFEKWAAEGAKSNTFSDSGVDTLDYMNLLLNGGGDYSTSAQYLTEDQRKNYNYLWYKDQAEGTNNAQQYLDYISKETMANATYGFGTEHPFLASLMSVPTSLGSGIEFVGDALKYVGDSFSDPYSAKLDKNSLAETTSTLRQGVSDTVDWNIGSWDAFDFLYNTGMSGVDSAVASFIPGGYMLLGLSAAANGVNDGLDRGMSDGQALANGVFSGIFEAVFEKISIGNLDSMKSLTPKTLKQFGKEMVKSMGVNASDEALTELANITYDIIANGELSQLQQLVGSGKSYLEAIGELGLQVLESGASGALMGFGFSGAASGVNAAVNSFKQNNIGKGIVADGKAQDYISRGLEMPDTRAFKYAEEAKARLDKGKSANVRIGKLAQNLSDSQMISSFRAQLGEESGDIAETLTDLVKGREVSNKAIRSILQNETALSMLNESFGTSFTADSKVEDVNEGIKKGFETPKTERDKIVDTLKKNVDSKGVNAYADTIEALQRGEVVSDKEINAFLKNPQALAALNEITGETFTKKSTTNTVRKAMVKDNMSRAGQALMYGATLDIGESGLKGLVSVANHSSGNMANIAQAYNAIYQAAKQGKAITDAKNPYLSELTHTQKLLAYEYGVMDSLEKKTSGEVLQKDGHFEKTNGTWIGKNPTANSETTSKKITPDMSDADRYDILKDKEITVASAIEEDVETQKYSSIIDALEKIHPRAKSKAEKIIRDLAEDLGILNCPLNTPELDFEFIFSKNKSLPESLSKQLKYGGSYADFAKVLINLKSVLNSAILIEQHSDKYEGKIREDRNLKAVYVLFSTLKDGNRVIPIQLEVKDYSHIDGRLYLTVALTKIEADVLGSTVDKNNQAHSLVSASTYSIAEIFKNVNTADKHFLKYLPDGFLSEEQIKAKQEALAEDKRRIEAMPDKEQQAKENAIEPERVVYSSEKAMAYDAVAEDKLSADQKKAVNVGKDIGRKVVIADTRTADGVPVDGFLGNDGVIYISKNNKSPVAFIFKHELAHFCERAGQKYRDFMKAVQFSATFKSWLKKKGYSSMLEYNSQIRKERSEVGIDPGEDGANNEIIANFVAEMMFGDDATIADRLIGELKPKQKRSVREFLRDFFEWIKGRFTGKGNTARTEILRLEKMFGQAFRTAVEVKQGRGEQFAFNDSFGQQLRDWQNGNGRATGTYNGRYFKLGTTPDILIKHGAPSGEVIMFEDCLLKITGLKHSISLDELAKIPSQLNDPILLFKGSVENSFVALTEIKDKLGNDVIVAIHINKKMGRSVINKITSVYSKTDDFGNNKINNYVTDQIKKGNLLDASTKKAPNWFTTSGLQLPHVVQTILDANNSISQKSEKSTQNSKKFSEDSSESFSYNPQNDASKRDGHSNTNFVEDKYYSRQIDKFETLKQGGYITVGKINEESPLDKVGIPHGSVYFDVSKILQEMRGRGDVIPVETMKHIPQVLDNPIVITEYVDRNGMHSVNVYGNLFLGSSPIVIGVMIAQTQKGNIISKIQTVHPNRNAIKEMTDSNILYLSENKKETKLWFQSLGTQTLPLGGNKFGFIRSISQSDAFVNSNKKEKSLVGVESFSYNPQNDKIDDVVGRYENGEITIDELKRLPKKPEADNPVSIANMKPEDMNTTPSVNKKTTGQVGDGDSKFADSVKKSKIFDEKFKAEVGDDNFVKHYRTITNKETLAEAAKLLDEGGEEYVAKWRKQDEKRMGAIDTAVGFILLKRYQDVGDYSSAAAVAQKIRNLGTIAGQNVQIFSIIGRFDADMMQAYAQKELDEALEKAQKAKGEAWAEKNKERFKLSDEEIAFIRDNILYAAKCPDGSRDRAIALAEICTLIQNKLPAKKGQWLRAWQRTSMLLNPKTLIRNIAGNGVMVPVFIMSDWFAAPIDRLASKKTGIRTTGVSARGAKEAFKGVVKGGKESADDYRRKINTRLTDLNRFNIGEGKSYNESTRFKALNKVAHALNEVDRFTSVCIEWGDRTFYEAWFMRSLENQKKLNGVNEPTEAMIEIAALEALERTWQDNNGMTKFVTNVKNGMNVLSIGGYGLGDVFIKFAKTPANLTKAIYDYSPAALISIGKVYRQYNRACKEGTVTPALQKRFVSTVGKALSGTMVYLVAAALFELSLLSGAGDEDDDTAAYERYIQGKPSYSLKIGDKWFSYDWAQPLGAAIAIVSDFMESREEGEDWFTGAKRAVEVGGKVLFDQSFMSSLNNFFSKNPISAIIVTIMEDPATLVPTVFSQTANLFDDKRRVTYDSTSELKTALNRVLVKIPGVRNTLEADVDIFGREVPNSQNDVWNAFFNPGNTYTDTSDEATNHVYEIYKSTGDKSAFPKKAEYSVTIKGKDIKLNTAARAKYQTTMGEISHEMIEALLENDVYNNLGDSDKLFVLNRVYEYAAKAAKCEVDGVYSYEVFSKIRPYVSEKEYNDMTEEEQMAVVDKEIFESDILIRDLSDVGMANYLVNAKLPAVISGLLERGDVDKAIELIGGIEESVATYELDEEYANQEIKDIKSNIKKAVTSFWKGAYGWADEKGNTEKKTQIEEMIRKLGLYVKVKRGQLVFDEDLFEEWLEKYKEEKQE